MRRNSTLAAAAVAVSLTTSALAGEVARQGKLWPITERDMREVIAEQVAQVDKQKIQNELKQSVTPYLENQANFGMPPPNRSATTWLDLTWTLQEDLPILVKNKDGSVAKRVLYPKGTRVNPIESNRPTDALVFFNGTNKLQVEAVKELVKRTPEKWMLIETAGNPAKATATIGRPVFHAEKVLLQRFAITHVPAVVFAGNGERRLHYGVATVAPPYLKSDFARIKELAFPGSTSSRSN